MRKLFSQFDPVSNRSFDEAEEHYVQVHTEFARKMFRENSPDVITYVPNRAMRQYSVAGKFNQKPRAWRWVIQYLPEDEFLPERFLPVIWQDHRNTLKNIRACMATERVVADRLSGQTALAKYMIAHDRKPGQSPEEAEAWHEGTFLPTVGKLLEEAFGFRRFVTNRVTSEAAVEALEEEGQVIVAGDVPTEKHAYDEIWFDNETWGSEFFARPEIFELLHFGPLDSPAYLMLEVTGLDRR